MATHKNLSDARTGADRTRPIQQKSPTPSQSPPRCPRVEPNLGWLAKEPLADCIASKAFYVHREGESKHASKHTSKQESASKSKQAQASASERKQAQTSASKRKQTSARKRTRAQEALSSKQGSKEASKRAMEQAKTRASSANAHPHRRVHCRAARFVVSRDWGEIRCCQPVRKISKKCPPTAWHHRMLSPPESKHGR